MTGFGGASDDGEATPGWHAIVGITLACVSGIFIGASFVFKKRGLLSANQVAGEGHAYLRSPMWWFGLVLMTVGEIANFAAYAFVPAILVTPLGAVSVAISAVLSSVFLKERLNFSGKIGCFQCIVGAVTVILNAPSSSASTTVASFYHFVGGIGFIVYAVICFLGLMALIFYVAPRHAKRHPIVHIAICSVVGSFLVVAAQGLGSAIVYSISHMDQGAATNQFRDWRIYPLILFVILTVVVQINFLNKALNLFSTAIVTPVYYVCFTTMTIVTSAVLFQGFRLASTPAAISMLMGFLCIVGGVALLFQYSLKLCKITDEEKVKLLANIDDMVRQPLLDAPLIPDTGLPAGVLATANRARNPFPMAKTPQTRSWNATPSQLEDAQRFTAMMQAAQSGPHAVTMLSGKDVRAMATAPSTAMAIHGSRDRARSAAVLSSVPSGSGPSECTLPFTFDADADAEAVLAAAPRAPPMQPGPSQGLGRDGHEGYAVASRANTLIQLGVDPEAATEAMLLAQTPPAHTAAGGHDPVPVVVLLDAPSAPLAHAHAHAHVAGHVQWAIQDPVSSAPTPHGIFATPGYGHSAPVYTPDATSAVLLTVPCAAAAAATAAATAAASHHASHLAPLSPDGERLTHQIRQSWLRSFPLSTFDVARHGGSNSIRASAAYGLADGSTHATPATASAVRLAASPSPAPRTGASPIRRFLSSFHDEPRGRGATVHPDDASPLSLQRSQSRGEGGTPREAATGGAGAAMTGVSTASGHAIAPASLAATSMPALQRLSPLSPTATALPAFLRTTSGHAAAATDGSGPSLSSVVAVPQAISHPIAPLESPSSGPFAANG